MTKKCSELIPGLPNDVGAWILSKVPYSHHGRLKATCKAWKAVLSSESFVGSLKKHNHLLCIFPQDPSIASPFLFDPTALAWCPLPPMPCNPRVYGLCNFSALALGSHLYVLGGSLFDTRSFPMDRPSPSSAAFRFTLHDFSWHPIAPMLSPRGSFACAALPRAHSIFASAASSETPRSLTCKMRCPWLAMEGHNSSNLMHFHVGTPPEGTSIGRRWIAGDAHHDGPCMQALHNRLCMLHNRLCENP